MMNLAGDCADLSRRGSGVLVHVTSLPGRYGIGDLGLEAHRWIDALAGARQRWWQMLPLGPTGENNSPYQCLSTFAGNPLLISPDLLVKDGLVKPAGARRAMLPHGRVDYRRVTQLKWELISTAYERFRNRRRGSRLLNEFDEFIALESAWLADFSLFMALRNKYGRKPWSTWPRNVLHRDPVALKAARVDVAGPIELEAFAQFVFFRQLQSLRAHARKSGVMLIGDMPIFVSPESCDVWKSPKLFQLDRHLQPRAVAGVPPDLFCSTGQRWGNPLYDWREMARDGYRWWQDRMAAALRQADMVRIDHFRGLEAYWSVRADCPTAEKGKWEKGPREKLLRALMARNSRLPVLAEDLGLITPPVERLRDDFRLPGMRVLQFGLPAEPRNPHVPHNFIHHCFAYTGTHDNDTSRGWYNALPTQRKRLVNQYAPDPLWKVAPAWAMIRILWASAAGQVIVPLQDLLNLGSRSRMNTPGHARNNWNWRCEDFAMCVKPMERLSELTQLYERQASSRGARA